MSDWERTLAWLAGVGAMVAVGRALTNKEELPWRVVAGRVILGSALSTVVTLILIPYPDAPMPVLVGAGAVVGILGEQVLELAARRFIAFRLGGGPK